MANIKNKYSSPLSTEFTPKDLVVDIKNGHLYYKSNLGVHKLVGDNLSTDTEEGVWQSGASNTLYYNGGNVGIGTTTPGEALEVIGNISASGLTITVSGSGDPDVRFATTTDHDLNIAFEAGSTGQSKFQIKVRDDVDRFDIASDTVNPIMSLSGSGNIGIGTTNPTSGALHVNSSEVDFVAYFHNTSLDVRSSDGIGIQCGANSNNTGSIRYIQMYDGDKTWQGAIQAGNGEEGSEEIANGVTLTSLSDRRQKHDIKITKFNLKDLMNIEVVDFKWNKTGTQSTGFIAQQVETVFPQAVTKPNRNTEFYGMDHAGLSPLIVKAVQDQQIIIDSLEARLKVLENKK